MRRRISHASRRPFGATLHRAVGRFSNRIALQLRPGLRAGGRSLISLVIGLVMLALIGLLVANFVGQVLQSARLEAELEAREAEVAALEAENRELEAAVAYAESDVNVERIAREQLGMARPEDTVLLPQMPTAAPPPTPATTEQASAAEQIAPAAPAEPNWRLWWQAFFPAEADLP